jgi:hypothetical protein
VNGVCNYNISSSGYSGFYTWEIQLVQAGFPLVQGHSYRLSFDVKADADRTFGVFLGENEGNWTNLIGVDRYNQNATTDWQTISLDFNAGCVFAYHKLSFELGSINTSMYFDNVMLIDLGPYQPSVGILGTSISGWDVDVDMLSTDGMHYTLSDFPLLSGIMKFRQDNMWCINWGNTTFPTGIGYLYGPDIPITNPGNYNITFNRETGEYSFSCVNNCTAFIGIIGSAVPPDYNWYSDVNMSTSDGITYTLQSYTFVDGEAKFRQDDSWDLNWGGASFPSGTASLGGLNIPVKAGNYNVTFNINTGEYSFSLPEIGILGSALTGWTDDIDMQTTDGIFYTLLNYTFTSGEVKFRQDNSWMINWGDYTFPTGYGYGNGPNIPVMEGNYNVTFNRMTGEYTFTATSCPNPGIRCPDNIYTGNSPGICGAYVFYPAAVALPNCGGEGITITQAAGLTSGSLFPVGTTTNTFLLTNSSGNSATCSFDVVVFDTEPPVIENLTTDPESIWPPNHKMVPVTVNYSISDNCSGTTNSQLWVMSNEPENGSGDGNTVTDWKVLDEHHVLLRAERSGTGTGREYYILIICWDESWNYTVQQVIVTVPHDMNLTKTKSTTKSSEIEAATENMPLKAKIWPNPGTEYFNLEVETSSDKNIELYLSDINGRLISVMNVLEKQYFRFGNDLKSGIYIATIRQGYYFKAIRIIKQ